MTTPIYDAMVAEWTARGWAIPHIPRPLPRRTPRRRPPNPGPVRDWFQPATSVDLADAVRQLADDDLTVAFPRIPADGTLTGASATLRHARQPVTPGAGIGTGE